MWEGFPGAGLSDVCVGLGLTTARSSDNVVIGLIALVGDHWLVLIVCRLLNVAEYTIGQVFGDATVHNCGKKGKKKEDMNQCQTDCKSGHWGHDVKDRLKHWAKTGCPKTDPRLGSFAFRCCNIIEILSGILCIFVREEKHLDFCKQKNVNQWWTSTGPSRQHIHEAMAWTKWVREAEFPTFLEEESHSRGCYSCSQITHFHSGAWVDAMCHQPGRQPWRTPAFGRPTWERKTSVGCAEPLIPSPHKNIFLCAHLFTAVRYLSLCSLFQLPSPPAFPLSCICYRLRILHSRPRYQQTATINPQWVRGAAQPWQYDGKGGRFHLLLSSSDFISFQRGALVYQLFLGSLSTVFYQGFMKE